MALFSSSSAVVGLDIGTSSLKLVELLSRRRGLEVATYAQANLSNLLTEVVGEDDDEIKNVANVVTRMFDEAGVATDRVVAALPSSVVFSTVLMLPDLPEADMEKAIHFAARDVVPANLDEMVLGWSKVGQPPHMDQAGTPATPMKAASTAPHRNAEVPIPIFLTAAPKDLVSRYTRLTELLRLELLALEVETFPLVRSLLSSAHDSAMIVDIGDRVTTFHIIADGTARVSHTIDYGGHAITQVISGQLKITFAQAELLKVTHGLQAGAQAELAQATMAAMQKILMQAKQLLDLYQQKEGRTFSKTVLIGGGSNLRGLAPLWTKFIGHTATVGKPWNGLSYPRELDVRLQELGPTYAVAVGLAERGFITV